MIETAEIDFDAAQTFMREARAAYKAGDRRKARAACVMVAVALGFAVPELVDSKELVGG